MFLQSHVIPIILYTEDAGSAYVHETIGTAFFINQNGFILTAKHVMNSAKQKSQEKGFKYGAVVKADYGKSSKSLIAPIINNENAPEPYDVTLAYIRYRLHTHLNLKFKPIEVMVWQRVATYGYPLNAISGDPNALRINIRAHKGIVQRILAPNDLPIGSSPAGYELNFLIGTGMSGSPLFIYAGETDTLVGICVGCSRTEEIDEVNEVKEGRSVYREIKLKISEFGIAQDLISLHQWKPKILGGKTLLEASQEPIDSQL